ncbi:retrovirus-related pol polyprotein from transposon TNT 1-94 [Tanacetum coccineum]
MGLCGIAKVAFGVYGVRLRSRHSRRSSCLDNHSKQCLFPNRGMLDAYDSDCDDVSNEKAVLMANLFNYGLDVISDVPHSEFYHNDMDNQSVHAMLDFKQTTVIDFPDNEKTSDSNIIPYSSYFARNTTGSCSRYFICMTDKIQLTYLIEAPSELPKDKSRDNQNALEILEYFENNDLKAQLQAKDTTICKLKEHIKSMRENDKEEKVKQDMDEIETINIELEHNLKGQIQEKVFVTTTLQNELRRLKGKNVLDNATTITNATTIAPGMFKLDLYSLASRITSTKVVHRKETIPHSVETQKQELKVYSRRPKQVKIVGSSKKAKIVESTNANNSEPNHTWGSNATDVPSSSSLVNDRLSRLFSGTVRFENDQIAKIMGYGDYQLDLEVAFWKNTCFIRNLEGVDLLSGSRDTNLYTISLDDMLKTSSICLLSKVSKTKSWLWNHRLSHLNFGTLKKLAKDGLTRGILKLKF